MCNAASARCYRRCKRMAAHCLAGMSLISSGQAVAQRGPESLPPSIAYLARIDQQKPIDFHAAVWPDTVFVNQQIFYQVGVFLNESARSRLAGNPEFLPPEFRGLITYEMATDRRNTELDVRGTGYDAHIFHRAVFPVTAGRVVIPSPQLNYRLRSAPGYFSRESGSSVAAESIPVFVKPLPVEGRPSDFTGAVGRFRSSTRVVSSGIRVGDPAVITLRVEGTGNIKLLTRPLLEVPWATVVNSSERLAVDTTGTIVKGVREFDWILTPSVVGKAVIPPIHYSYFDPWAMQYRYAVSDSQSVVIARGTLVQTDEAEGNTLLPLRANMKAPGVQQQIVTVVDSIASRQWLWLFAIAPIPALLLLVALPVLRSGKARPKSDPGRPGRISPEPIRKTGGTGSVDAAALARYTRLTLYDALAARLDVSVSQLAERKTLPGLLRRRGATRETVNELLDLLEALDHAAFAPAAKTATVTADALQGTSGPSTGHERASMSRVNDMSERARVITAAIERETIAPGVTAPHTGRNGLFAMLFLMQLSDPTAGIEPGFDAASAAYQQRSFVQASADFAQLAERYPESVDVLFNWGTAAWAQGDTVSAVIAWRRASRLDPVSLDLQQRIRLLPPGSRQGAGDAAPVTPETTFLLAALLWCVMWTLVAAVVLWRFRYPERGRRGTGMILRGATVGLLCIAAISVWAWRGMEEARLHPLFVVTRPDILRAEGGASGEAMGGVATGDVVREIGGGAGWIQVSHSDGRIGWLPSDRLAAIAPAQVGGGNQ